MALLSAAACRSIGIVLVMFFGIAGVFADFLAPYNPTSNDFAAMTEAPSWAHWLGTDQLGAICCRASCLALAPRLSSGLLRPLSAGLAASCRGRQRLFRGYIDLWLQRVDGHHHFLPADHSGAGGRLDLRHRHTERDRRHHDPADPALLRVVRSSALAIREIPYVDAARALGYGHMRIILCHMVPNVSRRFW